MIERVRTYHISLPNTYGREVQTSLHSISTAECVLVEIDAGAATGIGYAMTFRKRQTSAIRAVIHDLAESLSAEPSPRAQWRRMLDFLDYSGKTGLGLSAVSAIDTALWDLHAKLVGMPLFRLLGSDRTELPVYVTGGFLSSSIPELIDEAVGYSEAGFPRFKMKVGHPDGWREDVRRVARVRSAVGDSMDLYVDANQAWTPHQAAAAGHELGAIGVGWLEDPVSGEDLLGSADVARRLDLAVVVGELSYIDGFLEIIAQTSGDILMPDLMRCGGPTGVLGVANLAAASGFPVVSHAFTEVYAHVLSVAPNVRVLEYFPGWFTQLFEEPALVRNGAIHLADRPGLGLAFSAECKARFGLDEPVLVGE